MLLLLLLLLESTVRVAAQQGPEWPLTAATGLEARRAPTEISMPVIFMALVGAAFGQADPVTLRDHAIASSSAPVYLDGAWTAVNTVGGASTGGSLAATVPGDILSDLQRAKRAPDPYWNTTWREPKFVAMW